MTDDEDYEEEIEPHTHKGIIVWLVMLTVILFASWGAFETKNDGTVYLTYGEEFYNTAETHSGNFFVSLVYYDGKDASVEKHSIQITNPYVLNYVVDINVDLYGVTKQISEELKPGVNVFPLDFKDIGQGDELSIRLKVKKWGAPQ